MSNFFTFILLQIYKKKKHLHKAKPIDTYMHNIGCHIRFHVCICGN
jgi:hypothetical protein